MRVEGKPELFMFKVNGRAPKVQWRVQCPPDIQINLSHNDGPPKTGMYQHVKLNGGSNPGPTNK